ncbi:class I SAM-dependent methyltransferase [Synechococcus sp. PCC 7336]|uniref:class I SAM-dependent methyltransferase n=1 Tax=Synechococcus sp. PCC 7336 TaxID=195250 RepID=UPI00034735A6|nr:class I SAM-dependent methyltransferase [Synechococcus sp. PCC 7336]
MVNPAPPDSADRVTARVQQLYDRFPFPGEPIAGGEPPGFNWRWSWPQAYSFCTGGYPYPKKPRILDAGCGSGCGTEYIAHQNPEAEKWAIDLSANALAIARERCHKSGSPPVEFRHLSLYDVEQIPGSFDFINCVGVLHHLPDPTAGLKALADKLATGGIMHVFVYGELGRWEIRLMQQALRLLVAGDESANMETVEQLQAGLQAGRQLFEILPENNRIVSQEKARWAGENRADENFADMYLHPQEVDYNCNSLFAWIETSGLEFVRFSNPQFWNLDRLLGDRPELLARAQQLDRQQQYRLVELLDPVNAHYEFYLAKPPLPKFDWTAENSKAAIAHRSPCLWYWPGTTLLNYNFESVQLSESAYAFLQAADGQRTVAELRAALDEPPTAEELMQLWRSQVLLLEAI